MKRIFSAVALAATLSLSLASVAAAKGSPTCGDLLDDRPHGYHIIADYVTGIGSELMAGPGIDWPPRGLDASGGAVKPGGPGPGFHFPNNVPPGASFCIEQAHSGDR